MKQYIITPAMGKRLVGKAVAEMDEIQGALRQGTVVVVAGTTNGYVAEEILARLGKGASFSRKGFRRGVTLPPKMSASDVKTEFPGDLVLVNGEWIEGKEIFDVVDDLGAGDVVIKGANAINLKTRQTAVLIAHPEGGTVSALTSAVIGRRVNLIVPVGVEKRVDDDPMEMARLLNDPASSGPRMMPLPGGRSLTELDAIKQLTGADARLVAAGGIYGAQGASWIVVQGDEKQMDLADQLIRGVRNEPPCEV